MSGEAHVALINIGLHGHVIPTLQVARELVGRGHRVSYAVPEQFVPLVEATGAEPVGYRSAWPSDNDSLKTMADFTAIVAAMLDEAQGALPQLRERFSSDRPDVVMYDVFAYEARLLAHEWGVPSVNFWPFAGPYKGKDNGIAAVYRGLLTDPATTALRARFSRWLAEAGLDMPLDDFGLRPERGIASITPSLQQHYDRLEPAFTLVGPCFGERERSTEWQPPKDGKPLLLISLGSTFTNRPDFYRQCVSAVAERDWHVVLQTGKFVDRAALGDIPDSVEVHQWIPQFDVLAHTDVFLTHAGMGGTVEALYHGVPMLTLPQGADQFFISDRLTELGVGRRLRDDEVTGGGLFAAIEEVLALPDLKARLARLREEIHTSGGAAAAADIVERAMREHTG